MNIGRATVGTVEAFERKRKTEFGDYIKIEGAEIYVNSAGGIALVTNQTWVDILTHPADSTTVFKGRAK